MQPDIQFTAAVIEFIGGLILIRYIVVALLSLVRIGLDQARLVIADGVIMSLSFKLAATLLKTILLTSWEQMAMFAVILTFRILLKRLFTWEESRLNSNSRRVSARW